MISDSLNHASIIDGIRLCKAQRMRYDNNDMAELEQCLNDAAGARYRLIATDGVFSMDGVIANLSAICDLAEQYDAMVMVDDSHAVGFVGAARSRHARALRRDGPGRHHHRHARQGARRRQSAVTPAAAGRSSSGCVNGRARTCSATRSLRRSPPPRCACSTCWTRVTRCAGNSSATPNASARA